MTDTSPHWTVGQPSFSGTAEQVIEMGLAVRLMRADASVTEPHSSLSHWQPVAASILSDSALLDDLCEYRARQINAEADQ